MLVVKPDALFCVGEIMEISLYGRAIDLGPDPSSLAIKRWTGVLSPEPETVKWIESLPRDQGKRFFDIGASVGTHAVRAHLRGLSVTAFEPYEPVYNELVALVERNNLPILCEMNAMYSDNVIGRLRPGRSTTTFYQDLAHGQYVGAYTLDFYSYKYDAPDYIKLDVDGNEEAIIRGAASTLQSGVVKSLLVEVDPVVSPNLVSMLLELGYSYDRSQVEACMIRVGKYKGTANYVFYR